MVKLFVILLIFSLAFDANSQTTKCIFKPPRITIHFGKGIVTDPNNASASNYMRVSSYCPTDGHYTYTSYTSSCFRDDWFTVTEDHTPGDVDGNMMLVNGSHTSGSFLNTKINGLKGGTTYEFGAWLMNLCKITRKCPFPLLPKITIRLQTITGKLVAEFNTGELGRREAPKWTRYSAVFTTPSSQTDFVLTMIDNSPGGCGNDFALDDITFRECIKPVPLVSTKLKPAETAKKPPVTPKSVVRKSIQTPVKKQPQIGQPARPQIESPVRATPVQTTPIIKHRLPILPAPPPVLATRANPLIKQFETEAGEIKLELYDNGDIDGDTVSIYHNNTLVISRARLTQKPISLNITIDPAHPRHELTMVANNLGSIPPNTSMMVVTAGSKRYEVFISSNEQKNAKLVFELKK